MRLCRLCKRLFSDDRALCPDDKSHTVETELEVLPSELLARFPEREPLAQGGTGTLFLVDRPGSIEDQLGPQLVLKVLSAELTADPVERARHRRDLRKQQGLTHPQLPAVLEEGELAGRVWFTREYVPATNLAVRLHQSGAFALDAAIALILQLSAALDGLHQLGLVHRDLKPGHVLLPTGQPGGVQLIDATFASPLTADGARRGTPDYAAKEIIEGAASSARTDLYALGCLSYELIAGVPPFRRIYAGETDTDATLAAQRTVEPNALPDLVPQAVRSVIASMLSKDARRRPFSAQQVKRTIEPLIAPAKPAARSGSLSALQREAAALRATGSTAKPLAPTSSPDATVELDVKDLDEALLVSDEPDQRDANATHADLNVNAGDDNATRSVDRSATVSSASGTQPFPPVSARDLERLHRESAAPRRVPARGDATTRTHVPSDAAPEASESVDAAFDAPSPPPRRRTGTKFGMPAVRAQAAVVSEPAPSEPPRRSRTGTKFGIPAVGAHVAEPSPPQTVAEDAPRRVRTGTKFGMGPVSSADVAAAALAGQVQRAAPEPRPSSPAIREHGVQPSAALAAPRAARTRQSTTPRALWESPRVLLWAAGGLVTLFFLMRVVLGPAERARSTSVVVRVPQTAATEPIPEPDHAPLSELALIGGDIARAPLTAVTSARIRPTRPIAEPEPEPELEDPAAVESEPRNAVPTVSALSVRGGVARAASNRQATAGQLDFKAQGRELYREGRYREAADAYQRATQHNATDAAAYAGLGGSLLATGDVRKAITAYQRAVRLEPGVSGFQAALGRAYLTRGDRARARAAYSKALALDPNNQAARSGMASAKAR